MLVAPIKSEYGEYKLLIQQRADPLADIDTLVPRELLLEVGGPAPSLEAAVEVAASTASEFVRQLAFAANAWQGHFDVHIAFETTEGEHTRGFFQNWVVDEVGLPRSAREVDPDLMMLVLVAIAKLGERDRRRILRAAVHYSDALENWKPGSEIYALSHLYIAVEALTPLVIRREISRRGLKDRDALERALNGPPADSWKLRLARKIYRWAGGYVVNPLEYWARRDVIFRGDKETYTSAQRASNWLEHGAKTHVEIHQLASSSMEKTAKYVREMMFDLLNLDEEVKAKLSGSMYAAPFGSIRAQRQLFGELASDAREVAADGQLYPYVVWRASLRSYARGSDGEDQMSVQFNLRPVLADKVTLTVKDIVVGGPKPIVPRDVNINVVSDPTGFHDRDAHVQVAIDPKVAEGWPQALGSFILNANSLTKVATAWLQLLRPGSQVDGKSLRELAACVKAAGLSDLRLASAEVQWSRLWDELVALDDVRHEVSAARVEKEGLVVPGGGLAKEGPALLVYDRFVKVNEHAVEVASKLTSLLRDLKDKTPK